MISDDKPSKSLQPNGIKLMYIFIGIFLSALFIKFTYPHIINSFFEQDFLWFIPTVARETEGLSVAKLIGYFLSLVPLDQATVPLKIYSFIILLLFGPLAKYFIFTSILFHFACSILLFLLSRNLGLNSRISFLTSLVYLTLFAHFHAYMWPMAFQHLIVVFFILLTLNFYLKTVKLVENKKDYRLAYFLTLFFNLIASFCRASILILPLMIMTYILFCSNDGQMRVKRFDLWLPLFLAYLIYPLITLSFGDTRLFMYLSKIATPVAAKFLFMFSLGLFSLVLARRILAINLKDHMFKKVKMLSLGIVIFLAALLIVIGGVKRILIPYNFLLPFLSMLNSFFHPLSSTLLMDSARPHYFVAFGGDLFIFTLGISIIFVFIKEFFNRNKSFIILGAWYVVALAYLYIRNPLPSRYFIFISPIFCIVFCSAAVYLYSSFIETIKIKGIAREVILVFLLLSFCIPNLFAIKLALFKGRLVNTFMVYDYIRAANVIKDNYPESSSAKKINEKIVYVNNVVPIKFAHWEGFSAADTYNDNAKYVFMQVLGSMFKEIKLNKIPNEEGDHIVYYLDAYAITNSTGVNSDVFSKISEDGLNHLRFKHYGQAISLFENAIARRPFLLNYVLMGLSLDDFELVANGKDMQGWIQQITSRYSNELSSFNLKDSNEELKRINYVSKIMEKEINEYIKCIFYLSYLEHISGNFERSQYWFSKIRFLESDFTSLFCLLMQEPLIKSDASMLSFLKTKNNVSLSVKVDDYVDRFKFGKFIINLFFKI